jgi:hypothetical protein
MTRTYAKSQSEIDAGKWLRAATVPRSREPYDDYLQVVAIEAENLRLYCWVKQKNE